MKFDVTSADAAARITEVLKAITGSEEWGRHASSLASMDWLDSREPFRRFFDVYEDCEGEEWLGIMEWAVIEEMRSHGSDFAADQPSINSVIARLATHPNITLLNEGG